MYNNKRITNLDHYSQLKLNKMTIETTTVTQTANEILGTKDKNLYYLIVKNKKGDKLVINVGEKTHNGIKELMKHDK